MQSWNQVNISKMKNTKFIHSSIIYVIPINVFISSHIIHILNIVYYLMSITLIAHQICYMSLSYMYFLICILVSSLIHGLLKNTFKIFSWWIYYFIVVYLLLLSSWICGLAREHPVSTHWKLLSLHFWLSDLGFFYIYIYIFW